MNKAMQEIYTKVLKYGMNVSVIPATGEEPWILCLHVGFTREPIKYILQTEDGPVQFGGVRSAPKINTPLHATAVNRFRRGS